jgi:hypothetical protein
MVMGDRRDWGVAVRDKDPRSRFVLERFRSTEDPRPVTDVPWPLFNHVCAVCKKYRFGYKICDVYL